MGLGFGLISCQRSPGDPRTWGDLYREALDLTADTERLGFESVWNTEHHFVDDGYMPSLLTMAAAMAARTDRIAIGTGVLLAPLYHPLRLAEDAATAALVAQNRLILGLGLGWSEIEFDAFGADRTQRGRAMDEILSVLPQAWRGDVIHHTGSVYQIPEVAVRPVPDRPIPVVIGGGVDAAVQRAARLANGFFSNASPDRFAHQVRVGTEALEAAGRDPDQFTWYYYSVMVPGDDAEGAWSMARDHVWAMRWKYSDMEASADRVGPLPECPTLSAETESGLRRSTWIGTGEEIVTRMHELRERVGVDVRFVARSYFPTLPYGGQLEILERLAAEVLPHV